jgi:hypothetical protein
LIFQPNAIPSFTMAAVGLRCEFHKINGCPEVSMAMSFATDIRPLFRETPDIDAMKNFGLDLSSYESVKAQAEVIYSRLDDGSMPCDDPWPKEQIARFKQWMDEGMNP